MIYIVKQNGKECTSENFPTQKQKVLSAKFRSYKDAVRFLWFWDGKTKGYDPISCGEILVYGENTLTRVYKIEIQENK